MNTHHPNQELEHPWPVTNLLPSALHSPGLKPSPLALPQRLPAPGQVAWATRFPGQGRAGPGVPLMVNHAARPTPCTPRFWLPLPFTDSGERPGTGSSNLSSLQRGKVTPRESTGQTRDGRPPKDKFPLHLPSGELSREAPLSRTQLSSGHRVSSWLVWKWWPVRLGVTLCPSLLRLPQPRSTGRVA